MPRHIHALGHVGRGVCTMPSMESFSAPLARALESSSEVREGVRARGCLLAWPKDVKGVPSLKAVALNVATLTVFANVYCPKLDRVKSPRIAWLRCEAGWGMGIGFRKIH